VGGAGGYYPGDSGFYPGGPNPGDSGTYGPPGVGGNGYFNPASTFNDNMVGAVDSQNVELTTGNEEEETSGM